MADILVLVDTATTLLMPSMVFNPKTWRAASCEWGYRGDAAQAMSSLPVGKCRRWRPGGLDRFQPRHPRHRAFQGCAAWRYAITQGLAHPETRPPIRAGCHCDYNPFGEMPPQGGGPPGTWRKTPWPRLSTTMSWSVTTA